MNKNECLCKESGDQVDLAPTLTAEEVSERLEFADLSTIFACDKCPKGQDLDPSAKG